MHYNKSYIYPTGHTPFNEVRPERYNQSRSTPVWIPTLDLAGLELDCDNENDKEDNCTATPKDTKTESEKDESHVLFVRKPKPSFVFPSDSSFAHLEKMKSRHQLRHDDDANIVSVDSYRNGVTTVDPLPPSIMTSNDQSQYDDQIISFSLRDHNLEKYLRFDYKDLEVVGHQDNLSKAIEPERSLEKQESRPSQFKEKLKGAKFDDVNNNLQCSQDVYEVIVVNGHLKSDAGSSQEGKQDDDSKGDEVYHESNIDSEIAKGKSKPRVTFSFEENRTPRGSIKRYTPLKGEMHFQLQGVLKKRPPTSQVSNYSSSSDDTNKREKLRNSKNYPGNVKFSKSNYHLDHQSSLRVGLEHGIPVKHIHPTNADLEKKQSRISATDVVQKPPVSSTRITLSMAAEKAAIGASGRRTLTRSHNYSSAHTRGRMAYFRPVEGGRTPGSSTGLRSKSTEDVRYQETKKLQSDCSSKSAKSHTLPFGLRRCASSDHDLLTGTGSKQKPPKPKIAFGSFILPKEAVCQSRNNQIKFHDNDNKPASQGTYVHAHTRRSPYAAPAQLFLKENQKSEIQQRPLTAQIRQLPQQIIPAKELTHRHSAPSSYGQSRDKSFHSQKNVRLTINTSPARSQSMKTHMGLKATKPLTANVPTQSYLMRTTLPSGAQVSRVRKNMDFERPNRQNIAAMNMISRRDKGASHQQFVTKLQDYCNDVS